MKPPSLRGGGLEGKVVLLFWIPWLGAYPEAISPGTRGLPGTPGPAGRLRGAALLPSLPVLLTHSGWLGQKVGRDPSTDGGTQGGAPLAKCRLEQSAWTSPTFSLLPTPPPNCNLWPRPTG